MQIVGFIVGVVPRLHSLMIGSNAPLHVIEDSASMLGYVYIYIHLNFCLQDFGKLLHKVEYYATNCYIAVMLQFQQQHL